MIASIDFSGYCCGNEGGAVFSKHLNGILDFVRQYIEPICLPVADMQFETLLLFKRGHREVDNHVMKDIGDT